MNTSPLKQLAATLVVAVAAGAAFGLITVVPGSSALAEDWPAWMGSGRDGVYREAGLVDEIPADGLPIKWRVPIAGGYAGPAVADGRVFVFDYEISEGDVVNSPNDRTNLSGSERLIVLDEETGEELWRVSYDCPYSISYPAGPRCTPTVDGDRVYTLGSEGDLKCFSVADGSEIWSRSFTNDFAAEVPIWGFSAHPLIEGDLLYTMVGGDGQGVVAFDKNTGETVWQSLDARVGYCPPSIIEAGGTRQLIIYHPEAVASLDPANGEPYWSIPIQPAFDMSIAKPVVEGDKMYLSGIRDVSLMIRLNPDRPTAEEIWRGELKTAIHAANATPMFVDGVIYGTDCNKGSLMAIDAADCTPLWSTFEATKPGERRFIRHGTAFLTRLGDSDRYLIMSETGHLQMARLTEEGYEDLGRMKILEPTGECFNRDVVWSHPAYANQTAFARNDKEIVAVDLKK